jgi:hypothetical protein
MTTHSTTTREFFAYLLGREQTHDLALRLACVYDARPDARESDLRSTRVA